MSDQDPFDPLGIGRFREEQEKKTEDDPVFDDETMEEALEPELPIQYAPVQTQDLVPVDTGHEALREDNVPEDRRINMPEMQLPDTVTPTQKQLVASAMKDVVLFGAQASAMICEGDRCPYAKKCPLLRAKVPVPYQQECPVELYAMQVWMQAQMREMEINPHNVGSFYDVISSQAMTGLLLQHQRARWGEALNPILEQTFENVTKSGGAELTTIVKTGNYNTDYREKALKMIEKFAKQNMQTRERKAALTKSGWKDKSKHAAEVTERLAEIREVEETIQAMDSKGLPVSLKRVQRFHRPDDEDTPGEEA